MSETISFDSPYAVAPAQPDRPETIAPPTISQSEGEVEQSPTSFPAPPLMSQPDPVVVHQTAAPEPEGEAPAPILGSTSKSHLVGGRNTSQWTWENLRDYVVERIVETHGNFPRNLLKESGIFKGFIKRHGERSGEIAIYAMETSKGWWKNSPIGIERFAKGSDPWFAEEIIQIVDSRKRELTDHAQSA